MKLNLKFFDKFLESPLQVLVGTWAGDLVIIP